MGGFGWSLVALLVADAAAAQPRTKEYVGAAACGSCHAAQFGQQSATGHARSLRPAAEHPLANSFLPDSPLLRKPNFRFQFSKDFRVRVSDGKDALEAPIQWAFGAGDQAVTFVSQVDEDRYVEHHFSYYAATKSLESTPGHKDLPARSLPEALGVLYKTFDPDPKIMPCFQCHSTGPLSLGPKLDIRPRENGVRCEACHGPGSLHIANAARGEIQTARRLIENPRRLPAEGLNRLCGECHRQPAPAGVATNWNDAWNVRHQPLYLSQSACFRKSRGALSCLTCHDPHKTLRRNDATHYSALCANCHRAKPHPALNAKLDNCTGCHMPQAAPQAHLRFTNHWIGVYREGAPLRPQ